MRGALGNALLLNIIIFFLTVVMLIFVSVLAYSKAYRAKNRIVEVIEKYENYNSAAESEIEPALAEMGYQMGECSFGGSENTTEFKYCVTRKDNDDGTYSYRVTTYVQFYFPIIREFFSPAVTSETRTLGVNYNYE